MSFFSALIENILFFPYLLLAFGLLYLARWFFDWTTPRYLLDNDLIEKKNAPVSVMLVGYLLGVAATIAGSFYGLTGNHLENFFFILLSSLSGILLLRVSFIINDKWILHQFDVEKEIEEGGLGVSLVLSSTLLSSGLILNGVMQGTSEGGVLIFLRDITVYWLFGQLVLVLAGFLFQKITPYNIHDEVRKSPSAASYSMAGFLIATGLIAGESLKGLGSDYLFNLANSSLLSLWGLFLLLLSRGLIDTILLPKSRISDEIAKRDNVAVGIVVGASFVIMALFITGLYGGINQ